MSDAPTESETIAVEPEPEPKAKDPVETFRKGRAKREAKRKEVVIQEYVPPPEPELDVDSIVDRAVKAVFDKMDVAKAPVDKTPEKKTRPRPKPPAEKKEVPPTKYFGWC